MSNRIFCLLYHSVLRLHIRIKTSLSPRSEASFARYIVNLWLVMNIETKAFPLPASRWRTSYEHVSHPKLYTDVLYRFHYPHSTFVYWLIRFDLIQIGDHRKTIKTLRDWLQNTLAQGINQLRKIYLSHRIYSYCQNQVLSLYLRKLIRVWREECLKNGCVGRLLAEVMRTVCGKERKITIRSIHYLVQSFFIACGQSHSLCGC